MIRAKGKLDSLAPKERLASIYQSRANGLCFAGAYFDSRGGFLSIEGGDMGLIIQPGALTAETFVYISVKDENDDIHDLEQINTERHGVLVSPIVSCGPQGLKFNKKVTISLFVFK